MQGLRGSNYWQGICSRGMLKFVTHTAVKMHSTLQDHVGFIVSCDITSSLWTLPPV